MAWTRKTSRLYAIVQPLHILADLCFHLRRSCELSLQRRGLGGLDADACPIAKASQHPHRVFPREAKGRHIRKAEPSDHVANDLEVRLVELTFVEGIVGPGGGRQAPSWSATVSRVMSIFLSPYSLMARIHRVLDMPFDKHSVFIIDLLSETQSILAREALPKR